MSEIQRLPTMVNANPVHPNAKTTTQITNGTTTTKANMSSPVCRNCKTQTTPLWRRDETGQVLCNACGLFLKLHGRPRPISLKTDTIKLRNRIKQPNFLKLQDPNTPELKLKDAKGTVLPGAGKKLPKMKKRLANNSPPGEIAPGQGYAVFSGVSQNGSVHLPLQHPARAPFPGQFQQMSHFSGPLPHQVQLLHYPSLTPTQFAPGLQRITSPLLLSTTPLMLNTRASTGPLAAPKILSPKGPLTAVQAAGALENMSNELGPSATFKAGASLDGVSLMGTKSRGGLPSLSTPSTELKAAAHPPKLPALGLGHEPDAKNVIALPSFGPQFRLQEPAQKADPDQPKPTLPPIQHTAKVVRTLSSGTPEQTLPSPAPLMAAAQPSSGYNYSAHQASHAAPHTSATPSQGAPDGGEAKEQGSERDESNGGNGGSNNNSSGGAYETTLLKTRISELELVNDLYRTRIMELEAMEQAARLRENSMRKRLDEILALQGQGFALNSTVKFKREGDAVDASAKRAKTN